MQDATKVLLGSTGSSDKDVTCEPDDPATFKAGYAVRRKSTGLLSLAVGDGSLIGVSLGRSLSDCKKTAVVRVGNQIPLRLKAALALVTVGDIVFTAKPWGVLGNDLTITLQDGDTEAGATNETDSESPNDIIIQIEDGVTTAQTIVDMIEADETLNALISAAIAEGEEASAQDAAAEAPFIDGDDVAVPGAAVLLDTTTGEAAVDGAFTSAATFLSGPLVGVDEDASTCYVAYIAMPGGF